MPSHTIDADTGMRKASEVARFGNRYYPVDKTYDKRVYENTWGNYARITLTLFAFWIANACHWWGVFSLGIVDADALIWYSIACFLFTIFFLAGLLISGKGANRMKREHDFLLEKLAEKTGEIKDKETKLEQEAAHEIKLNKQAARIANKRKADAEAASALEAEQAQMTGKGEKPGIFQQVVTHI